MSSINSIANIIPANNFTISAGNIIMADTTASTRGIYILGSTRFLHAYPGVSHNTFTGGNAGNLTMTGVDNSGYGATSLMSLTSGPNNNAQGSGSLSSLTTGDSNCGVGHGAGNALVSGDHNTFIGTGAGSAYTGAESNNITIGNAVTGTTGESNVTRIGTGTTKTFIAGIRGITTVNADAIAVLIDSAGQLGTVSSSIRFKENVQDIGVESGRVLDLRPVKFNYIKDENKNKHYGLIAEEVEKILPELVIYDDDGQPLTIKYQDIPVLLLNEIKKLKQRIQVLEMKD